MVRTIRFVGVMLFAALLAFGAQVPAPAMAQSKLCFAEVPDCIEGRFAEYWQQNGGLPVFGYPIAPAKLENVGGGQFLVQPFERNRFELHPENARPYDVLLGRLGDDRLRQLGRPWENEPKATTTSKDGCQYFSQTGHLLCGAFRSYWSSNGLNLDGRSGFTEAESLALFGLPITESKVETDSQGRQFETQWFERARFELHPEIGPNVVLLGLLGRETQGGAPAPAPTSCNDVPEPVNARIRPGKCFDAGTPAAVDVFGFTPNEQVGYWFNTPEGIIFGTIQTLQIGPSGAANDLRLNTTDFTPGIWSFVMEGVSSGHKSIAYFRITGNPAPAPTPGDTSVPASQNAFVLPESGPAGTEFASYGYGFTPGENIGVYVTAPDQSVVGAPFQVRADDNGESEVVTFSSAPGMQPGIYAFTFEGVNSKAKAIAYFRILP